MKSALFVCEYLECISAQLFTLGPNSAHLQSLGGYAKSLVNL